VPVYDWVKFLETFLEENPGIRKFHHFRFTREYPGVVFCRILSGLEEIEFIFLKDPAVRPLTHLPLPIVPLGLDGDRQGICTG